MVAIGVSKFERFVASPFRLLLLIVFWFNNRLLYQNCEVLGSRFPYCAVTLYAFICFCNFLHSNSVQRQVKNHHRHVLNVIMKLTLKYCFTVFAWARIVVIHYSWNLLGRAVATLIVSSVLEPLYFEQALPPADTPLHEQVTELRRVLHNKPYPYEHLQENVLAREKTMQCSVQAALF